jgi:hypothetical protein
MADSFPALFKRASQFAYRVVTASTRCASRQDTVTSMQVITSQLGRGFIDRGDTYLERDMQRMMQVAIGGALLGLAISVAAQKPIIYPAKGQSAAQQNRDDGECHVWAKQSTGIDPAAVAAAPPPQTGQTSGAPVGRSMVGGALGGAVIGEIAGGHSGEGAAIGALVGTRRGIQQQQQQQKQAAAQQSQAQQQRLDTYYRAYGACMSGRGYTIR